MKTMAGAIHIPSRSSAKTLLYQDLSKEGQSGTEIQRLAVLPSAQSICPSPSLPFFAWPRVGNLKSIGSRTQFGVTWFLQSSSSATRNENFQFWGFEKRNKGIFHDECPSRLPELPSTLYRVVPYRR